MDFFSFLTLLFWVALIFFLYKLLFSRSPARKRQQFLEKTIEELIILQKENPELTVKQLLKQYTHELQQLTYGITATQPDPEEQETYAENEPALAVDTPMQAQPSVQASQVQEEPQYQTPQEDPFTLSLKNWYSDNSINLLLYIGAFLIVASAGVFVGFSWAAISGLSKALFLSVFTLAFFGCGVLFYKSEKIRNAGLTFLGIAGILLPFNGIAWHNFYLSPLGVSVGATWLVTSLLALGYYLTLVLTLRSKLYGYFSAVTSLSCMLALVSLGHLQNEYYILGAILSSLFLLISANLAKKQEVIPQDTITPFMVSAHIIMPISLSFGLFFALVNATLFTFPTAIAVLLTCIYYYLAYRFSEEGAFLSVAQLLLPVGIYIFCKAADVPTLAIVIIMQLISFGYLYGSQYVRSKDQNFTVMAHAILIFATFLGVTLLTFETKLFSYQNTVLIAISALYFSMGYVLKKERAMLTMVGMLVPATVFFLCQAYGLTIRWTNNAVIFTLILGMLATTYKKRHEDFTESFLPIATILFPLFQAGTLFAGFFQPTLFSAEQVVSTFLGVVFYALCSYLFKKDIYVQAAGALGLFGVFVFCKFLDIDSIQSLIVVQIVSICYSLAYIIPTQQFSQTKLLFSLSSYITPAISVLMILLSIEHLFTREIVTTGVLLVMYYALLYKYLKNPWHLSVAQSILFVCAYVYVSWRHVPPSYFYYVLVSIPLLYTLLYSILSHKKLQVERLHTGIISLTCYALVFLLGFAANQSNTALLIFAVLPAAAGMLFWYVSKNPLAIWYHLAFTYLALWILIFKFFPGVHERELFSLALCAITICYYALAVVAKKSFENFQTLVAICVINMFISTSLSIDKPASVLLANILCAGMFTHYALQFGKSVLLYGTNMFLAFSFWSIARIMHLDMAWYPLYFSVFSLALYAASFLSKYPEIAQIYRYSGLASQLITTIWFGMIGYTENEQVFRSALVSSYLLTTLFAFDAKRFANQSLAYLSSAIGVGTYMWQMSYLGYTEMLVYSIPLGIYFLVLSFTHRQNKKEETALVFDYSALFFLLAPTLFQMTGTSSAYYALFLGAESIAVFALGITLKQKHYVYIGIAGLVVSVISQTYEFFFSLPRWIILAIAGISFLGTAIYLLLLRGNKK